MEQNNKIIDEEKAIRRKRLTFISLGSIVALGGLATALTLGLTQENKDTPAPLNMNVVLTQKDIDDMFTLEAGSLPSSFKYDMNPSDKFKDIKVSFVNPSYKTQKLSAKTEIEIKLEPKAVGQTITFDGVKGGAGSPVTVKYVAEVPDPLVVLLPKENVIKMLKADPGPILHNDKDSYTFTPGAIGGITFTSDVDTTKEYGIGDTIKITATPDSEHTIKKTSTSTPSTSAVEYIYTIPSVLDDSTP